MRVLRVALVLVPIFLFVVLGRGDEATERTATRPVGDSVISGFQGSGSCSAVACHGNIMRLDPLVSRVWRNEHTTWISDDPHSRSYQVLFDERSERIVRSLAAEPDQV